MFRLLFSPVRMIRFGIRLAGFRNSLLIGIGIAIGLLIAPKPGAELRQDLASRLEERRSGGGLGSSVDGAPSPVT